MILYHYTAREYLDAIMAEGLTKGDVPVSATEGVSAVWLTTDPDPEGHGLSEGGALSEEDRLLYMRCFGKIPGEGACWANKRAVRITVRIPSTDRRLKHWPKWGRKRLASDFYEALNSTGGGKSATWYLFFGTIPSTEFVAVEVQPTGGNPAAVLAMLPLRGKATI